MQDVARDLDPFVDEDRLHLCANGANDEEVRVTSMPRGRSMWRSIFVSSPTKSETNSPANRHRLATPTATNTQRDL
jgi:hypothetical protein